MPYGDYFKKQHSLRWVLFLFAEPFSALFTFWDIYGIIVLGGYLLDKLEFDEWRFQSEKAIKKIIIKTACTHFDSFYKHNLLFSILSFYQAILHEEMSFFIIKSLFSYLCFGCCIDVCWIILIHRNRRNFTCVDGYCNELRFLQILQQHSRSVNSNL